MGNEMTLDATAKKFLAVQAERQLPRNPRQFRKRQDAEYISEFDREMAKYLKGGEPD